MKKLFALIFSLTLSTNSFSWGGDAPCDKFLDYRKSNAKHELVTADVAAFTFYIFGMMDILPSRDKQLSEYLDQLIKNPTVTSNQRLYLIEKGCREQPTESTQVIALITYRKIVEKFLAKKSLEEN